MCFAYTRQRDRHTQRGEEREQEAEPSLKLAWLAKGWEEDPVLAEMDKACKVRD